MILSTKPFEGIKTSSMKAFVVNHLSQHHECFISVGYVSGESLRSLFEIGPRKNTSVLIVGMSQEGFTHVQERWFKKLIGHGWEVRFAFNDHQKLYFFKDGVGIKQYVLGSANLDSALSDVSEYRESNYCLDSRKESDQESIHAFDQIKLDLKKNSISLEEGFQIVIKKNQSKNTFLEKYSSVSEAVGATLCKNKKSKFELEKVDVSLIVLEDEPSLILSLKVHEKSNMNICFATPRYDARKDGSVRETTRGYYEIEFNIKAGFLFPLSAEIIVDGGFVIPVHRTGDKNKNLRARGASEPFGRWFKGKLMDAGIILEGEKITEEHLKMYGTNHMVLKKVKGSNHWVVSFDPSNGWVG